MFLSNGVVSFRAIERKDLEQIKEWRNDPDVRCSFREFMPLSMDNQEIWFASLKDRKHIMFAIMIEGDAAAPVFAGVCGLTNIDWHNGCTEVSWYVGVKKLQGYDGTILKMLLAYGFGECRLHRIEAEVYLLALDRQMYLVDAGFNDEGLKHDAVFRDDRWWDSNRMYILEDEWRLQVDR